MNITSHEDAAASENYVPGGIVDDVPRARRYLQNELGDRFDASRIDAFLSAAPRWSTSSSATASAGTLVHACCGKIDPSSSISIAVGTDMASIMGATTRAGGINLGPG